MKEHSQLSFASGSTTQLKAAALLSRPVFSVLFVCTANLCRSPMAQGLLMQRMGELGVGSRVRVDSAGIKVSRRGQPPDPRAQVQCLNYGINIRRLRTRAVKPQDFARFDYILGMSSAHMEWLREHAEGDMRARLALLMEFAANCDEREVPDPYFEKAAGFARVLALLQSGVDGFVAEVLEPELRSRGLIS